MAESSGYVSNSAITSSVGITRGGQLPTAFTQHVRSIGSSSGAANVKLIFDAFILLTHSLVSLYLLAIKVSG
jgi:hypothetical protein